MKKAVKLFSLITGFAMLALLQSCGDTAFYDQVHSFDDKSWDKIDTAVFEVDVQDSLTNRDFILSLRTSTEYLYSDLWVYIMVTAPDGTTSKAAQKIPLARPDGSWIGRVSGTLVESRLRFDSKPFPIKGPYVFMITNATQEESIPNVMDIGLRIE
ncbi:MAG TPA: gliding motility lipoprotein GldH [Brumimicrobium sp.]|nr:gliding motility lipoprotein GldH [Brumimicrobium sp.]